MNKLTKLLSVFAIAGAIGAGVAGAAGCHKHTYSEDWTGDADGHYHVATCHPDVHDKTEAHGTANSEGKCPTCGYQLNTPTPSEKLVVPKNVTGILVEGVSQETVTLSSTKKSHTIDKSAIKVYFATGANADTKSTEVPAANVVLELKDSAGAAVSSWENITKDGAYRVNVSLTNAEMEAGATVTLSALRKTVTVTISNPAVAGSLAVKTGDGVKTTQVQSTTNEILSTWKFEVTLANGDKQDVPASEVTVSGLDTTKATESGVATLTWGTITGTQSYTITADETKVAQSFAVNFGELTDEQKTKLKTEDVSIQGGRFVVQATGGEVADHRGSAPEFGDKYLASRLKMGGKYDGDNAKRYVKITTDGAASITVYGYANSGTEGAGDADRYLCLYKNVTYGPKGGDETKIVGTGSDLIGEKQNTKQKENTKHEWTVDEAGTYWLVCETGDVCITYIQVDQLVAKEEGVNPIVLTGETKLAKLSVKSTTKDYKQTFTVGDTFSVNEEYSLTGIYYNTATMDKVKEEAVTTGVTYWLGETQLTPGTTVLSADKFDKLGENTIKVKVGEETETATYTVIVESAVSGITGITASLKSTVNPVLANASAKLTLNKTDIELALVGENANAQIVESSIVVKYKAKDADDSTATEITDSAQLGVGDYVIIVTATVEDATANKSASFEATAALKVSVEGNGASWLYQDQDANKTVGAGNTSYAANDVLDNNGSFTAKALVQAKSGNEQNGSFGTNVTASVPKAAAEKTASGEEITFTNALAFVTKAGTGTEYLEITAKKATTIYVYLTCSDDGHKSNRAGAKVYYTINGTACEAANEVEVTNRTDTTVLKVTLAANDVLKVAVKQGGASNDPRVWFYGIEAVDVAAE